LARLLPPAHPVSAWGGAQTLEACKPALRRAGADARRLAEYVDALALPFACLLAPSYFDVQVRAMRHLLYSVRWLRRARRAGVGRWPPRRRWR
jgi:hypothetical protein